MKLKTLNTVLLFLTCILSVSAFSEGNALSNSITSHTVKDPNQVQENHQDEQSGREYKAHDATAQGNTGTGAAIATGSALVAAALPLLNSIFPYERAAGAALMANAGMEFAQAGADAGSAGRNKNQEQLLTSPDTSLSSANADISSQIKTPALDNLLSSRGVDPDAFKRQLASGNLGNPEDVLKAMGDDTSLSPEDIAQGRNIASQAAGSMMSDPQTSHPELSPMVSNNENAPEVNGTQDTSQSADSTSFAASQSLNASDDLSGDAPVESSAVVLNLPGVPSPHQSSAQKNQGVASRRSFSSLLAGERELLKNLLPSQDLVSATAGSSASQTVALALLREKLMARGIVRPAGRATLFQTARRNYRSFGKWRKNNRPVAKN